MASSFTQSAPFTARTAQVVEVHGESAPEEDRKDYFLSQAKGPWRLGNNWQVYCLGLNYTNGSTVHHILVQTIRHYDTFRYELSNQTFFKPGDTGVMALVL